MFFKQVITIEACPDLYYQLTWFPQNVRFILGNSAEMLGKVRPAMPCIFWLDAHFVLSIEGNLEIPTIPGYPECPLLGELTAVRENDIVFIDDARYFRLGNHQPFADPEQWPTIAEILAVLPTSMQLYAFDDFLICCLSKYHKFFQDHVSNLEWLGSGTLGA